MGLFLFVEIIIKKEKEILEFLSFSVPLHLRLLSYPLIKVKRVKMWYHKWEYCWLQAQIT